MFHKNGQKQFEVKTNYAKTEGRLDKQITIPTRVNMKVVQTLHFTSDDVLCNELLPFTEKIVSHFQ